jgi:Tfp pilus assembly protein PilV
MRHAPGHQARFSPYHLDVVTGPEAANGRRTIAYVVLAIGLLGLAASLVGVAIELMPRQFDAAQRQQIMTWEEASRWREMPAGEIFAPQVTYGRLDALAYVGIFLPLTARRIGIARPASCGAATDKSAAAVLSRNGCEAVLLATYADDTDTYVVTVGVGTFASTAQAAAAERELGSPKLSLGAGRAPGVHAVAFAGTPAAAFTDSRRQISASVVAGPYLVMYTIGYADDRPLLPVSDDSYGQAEMTSMGAGVTQAVATVLGSAPPTPHCPGATGC